jgi:HTH-type transcriptional regulator/antitoxin HigA
MRKLKLSQDWITRATSDTTAEDIFVGGRIHSSLPSDDDVSAVVAQAAGADAVREMVRRKWFVPATTEDRTTSRWRALKEFLFSPNNHRPILAATTMFRRQQRQRDFLDEMATLAWLCRIMDRAAENRPQRVFKAKELGDQAISHIVKLSTRSTGPSEAIDFLMNVGITVVIENALPGMRTDGVSFVAEGVGPVIGLTLRYDRLDSFWFTLLHEVGHIVLHLSDKPGDVFIDSLDDEESDEMEVEAEANAFAKDSFIPRDTWLRSEAFRFGTESAIIALAKQCGVHTAIVAGRLRFEKRKYYEYTKFLGTGELRDTLMSE